jgi:hypothetical protein
MAMRADSSSCRSLRNLQFAFDGKRLLPCSAYGYLAREWPYDQKARLLIGANLLNLKPASGLEPLTC